MARKSIIDIMCGLLIMLFIYAAVSKLRDYPSFKVQLGQSPLLTAYVNIIAWTIPSLEIIIALMLALPKHRLVGLYCSFTLMVLFTAYIVAILKFSDYVPCSCGGVLSHMTWGTHLVFNMIFVLLALIGILLYPTGPLKQPLTTFSNEK